MADVTVTAVDVRPLVNARTYRRQLGEEISVGTLVYLKSDGKVWKADADAAPSSMAIGVVVSVFTAGTTVGYAGEWADVLVYGPCAGFSGLTPGALMYSSVTAGAIADASPAGSSGDFRWIVGFAWDANTIFVQPFTDIFTAL